MATLAERIAELETLIDGATQSVSSDGFSATFDIDAARKRLAELKAQQAGSSWPRASTIKLSSGFSDE
jgi:hypothetical protein